jgi:release factor glutamine methyltransferase
MTVQTAFTEISNALEPLHDAREAASIANMLLEDITGLSRVDRIVYKDRELTAPQVEQVTAGLQALLQNQPVQYVIGKSWFYGMELQVNANVLIPRPETEELVEWIVLEHSGGRLLDIGTGSGAIPIALKKNLPKATVWAVDVSSGALQVAQANALQQKQEVHFLLLDILSSEAATQLSEFDVIVSNPPYICEKEKAGMQEQVVQYEPSLALFVPDDDALLFYRAIGSLAQQKLIAGGDLYFEIHEAYGKEVVALLEQQGYQHVILRKDMYGKDRMVKATKA